MYDIKVTAYKAYKDFYNSNDARNNKVYYDSDIAYRITEETITL